MNDFADRNFDVTSRATRNARWSRARSIREALALCAGLGLDRARIAMTLTGSRNC
jgi:hypothetical protein